MLDLGKKLEKFSKGDKEFIDRISAKEDKLHCYNSDIELAEEKGKTEGKIEAKIELAQNMLQDDKSIDEIIYESF